MTLLKQFQVILRDGSVSNDAHGSYKKWLRDYLDFYQKDRFSERRRQSLGQFPH